MDVIVKTYTDQELEDRLLDYLYDELEPKARADFEEAVATRPELLAELEAHRATRAAMQELAPLSGGPALEAALASVMAEADAVAASGSVAASAPLEPWWRRLGASLRQSFMSPAFAAAFAAVLVAGGAVWLVERGGTQTGERLGEAKVEPVTVAEAMVAPALDEAAAEEEEVELLALVDRESLDDRGEEGAAEENSELNDAVLAVAELAAVLDAPPPAAPLSQSAPARPAAQAARPAAKKVAARPKVKADAKIVAGLALDDEIGAPPSNYLEPALGVSGASRRDSGYAPAPEQQLALSKDALAEEADEARVRSEAEVAAAPRVAEVQGRRERTTAARPQADSDQRLDRAAGGSSGNAREQDYASADKVVEALWARFDKELRADNIAAAEATLAQLKSRGVDAEALRRAEVRLATARRAEIKRAAPTPAADR